MCTVLLVYVVVSRKIEIDRERDWLDLLSCESFAVVIVVVVVVVVVSGYK